MVASLHSVAPAVQSQGSQDALPELSTHVSRDPQGVSGTHWSPRAEQVTGDPLWQMPDPAAHKSVTQLPASQNSLGEHWLSFRQATQAFVAKSHSSPSAVQSLSESQLVRQAAPTHTSSTGQS